MRPGIINISSKGGISINICVLGWYGTETLGDRSILLGLSKIFNGNFGQCTILLGSIYPFFSRRCLIEDREFYKKIAPGVTIEIFDVKEYSELNSAIKKCSLVVMGGGPIMDLLDLGIIEYGFGYARKLKKKTALLGCGIGPLFQPKFRKIAAHILKLSDIAVLRDIISREAAVQLMAEYKYDYASESLKVIFDPAVIPMRDFKKDDFSKESGVLGVNLREFPICCSKDSKNIDDEIFVNILKYASGIFKKIKLIPQHTLVVGGDDRHYLSLIAQRILAERCITADKIEVLHKPLSLYELFKEYYTAECCIGMRYHSVLFQTVLNGKNSILDYTEPGTGKTSGFLSTFGIKSSYKNLYINIQESNPDPEVFISNLKEHTPVKISETIFNDTLNEYRTVLNKLIR